MIEDHKRLVSRVAKFQSALDALLGSIMAQDERTEARLTALESRPCSPASSASPAAASVGSAGIDGSASSAAHAVEKKSSATSVSAAASTTPDPTAAIRADPRRPRWLREEMLPLPVGTERVYNWVTGDALWTFPNQKYMTPQGEWIAGRWFESELLAWDSKGRQVYHVPQPAPALESILGTASAAKAVEQGVADVSEGRTRQVDSLDQLAAEAQAEGEYGTAWKFENCKFVHDGHANVTRCQPPTPRRTAREVAEEIVKRWLAYGATSPGTAQQLMASITAAIERDREGR